MPSIPTTLTGMLGQLPDGILIQWSTRDRSEVMREALQTKQEFWDQFVREGPCPQARSPRRGQTGEEGSAVGDRADETLLCRRRDHQGIPLYMVAAAFTTSTAVTTASQNCRLVQ